MYTHMRRRLQYIRGLGKVVELGYFSWWRPYWDHMIRPSSNIGMTIYTMSGHIWNQKVPQGNSLLQKNASQFASFMRLVRQTTFPILWYCGTLGKTQMEHYLCIQCTCFALHFVTYMLKNILCMPAFVLTFIGFVDVCLVCLDSIFLHDKKTTILLM